MTPLAGSNMEEQKVEQKMPWEQDWIQKPIQAVKTLVNDAVEGFKAPWERDWKQKPAQPITPVEKAPVARSKGFDMDSYLKTTAAVESGNNPGIKAKESSATGLYQFTAGTWNDMVNSMGVNYTLNDRKDPEKAHEVMREFTSRNLEKAKKDLGRDPTHTEAYLYHFLGRSAPKVLSASEDAKAVDLVTKAQAKANKNVFFNKDGSARTVGDIVSRFKEKYGEK